MMTSGKSWRLKTRSLNRRAYFLAVVPFLHGMKWTLFVNQSINAAMTVIPSDSGKLVIRSVLIYCHLHFSRVTGYRRPAFFLWSDFVSWQNGHHFLYCATWCHVLHHQNARLILSTVFCIPTCPIVGTYWCSSIVSCLRDYGTTTFSWSSSIWYRAPRGNSYIICRLSSSLDKATKVSISSWVFLSYLNSWISRLDNEALDAWIKWSNFGVELMLGPHPLRWFLSFLFLSLGGLVVLRASAGMLAFLGWYLIFGRID